MLFFDLAIIVVLVAVLAALSVGTVSLVAGFKRRRVTVDGDCRETALIMHGEGARADCN